MALSATSPDNPEEIEIDRLLLELGIVLPAVEDIVNQEPPLGIKNAQPSPPDAAAESSQEEDSGASSWLPHLLAPMLPWPPETES